MSNAAVPYQAYKSKRHSRHLSNPPDLSDSSPALIHPPTRVDSLLPPNPDHRPPSPPPAAPQPGPSEPATPLSPRPRQTSKFRHVPFRSSTPATTPPKTPQPDSRPAEPLPVVAVRPVDFALKEREIVHLPPPSPSSISVPSSSRPTPSPTPPPPQAVDIRVRTLSAQSSPGGGSANRAPRPSTYRSGFQPKGVYRHRTDEYLQLRGEARQAGKIEHQRLERRLEKIIDLHFGSNRRPSTENRRHSFLFNLDFTSKSPGDLWREMVDPATPDSIRAAEQAITPWEDDKDVKACPFCQASFHPLSNRKHHCRICGRIICALPVKAPNRLRRCSLLFIANIEAGQIEEIEEGVDYGVRSLDASKSAEEKFLRGVRICRDCQHYLRRKQYMLEIRTTPLFATLHSAMMSLEQEIEASLKDLEELITTNPDGLGLQNSEFSEARQQAMALFSNYEAIAKRIRALPSPAGAGSSQDRIQKAVATHANLFLQKRIFLKALTRQALASEMNPQTSGSVNKWVDSDSELARKLQPLLEQEVVLEAFIEDARTQRRFDDVKSLVINLKEIRDEIDRLSQGGAS